MGTLRVTFVIDPDGMIKKMINKVDNENASQQVTDLLQ
jgi:peroxiredoxin